MSPEDLFPLTSAEYYYHVPYVILRCSNCKFRWQAEEFYNPCPICDNLLKENYIRYRDKYGYLPVDLWPGTEQD